MTRASANRFTLKSASLFAGILFLGSLGLNGRAAEIGGELKCCDKATLTRAGFGGKADRKGQAYDPNDIRKFTLMAEGAGVEYYFGYRLPHYLVCEDWQSRDKSWDYCRIALAFFSKNNVPFWEMTNADALVGNAGNDNTRYCLAKAGDMYVVYLPSGGATGAFEVKWYDPRHGGLLREGTVKHVDAGGNVRLGEPPSDPAEDWVALVRRGL